METAQFFKRDFEENGSMERVTLFLNLVNFYCFLFVWRLFDIKLCKSDIRGCSCVDIFHPSNTNKAYLET